VAESPPVDASGDAASGPEVSGPANSPESTGPVDSPDATGPVDSPDATGPVDSPDATGPDSSGPTGAESVLEKAKRLAREKKYAPQGKH